jgi:hypothetical protein
MASTFKGMSKENFLDGLVLESGLNGHELYNYLISAIRENKKAEVKKEEPVFTKPLKEREYFSGSRQELYKYILDHGGDTTYLCCGSEEAIASYVAKLTNCKIFVWTRQYMNSPHTYEVYGINPQEDKRI